jgi:hypothetical protein
MTEETREFFMKNAVSCCLVVTKLEKGSQSLVKLPNTILYEGGLISFAST